ncbi:MAG: ribosome-associated translation inhibitor RaiA [Candidatus Wallbacteria bacterium]|nr:ribosome-associated translation inhibitor RaiA [Candidatus Wallbacteria bacterium]
MKFIIQAKNVSLNASVKEYAEKKFSNLKKYFENIIEIDVTFGVEQSKAAEKSHYVDVTLWTNGMTLNAKERAESFTACTDFAADKLEKQVKRYKDKLKQRSKTAIPKADRMAWDNVIEIQPDTEETNPRIIRTRKFSLKPMFLDEAAMQLSMLKQEFLVFTNADTEKINVLYRRKDGNFGLIAPEETV